MSHLCKEFSQENLLGLFEFQAYKYFTMEQADQLLLTNAEYLILTKCKETLIIHPKIFDNQKDSEKPYIYDFVKKLHNAFCPLSGVEFLSLGVILKQKNKTVNSMVK